MERLRLKRSWWIEGGEKAEEVQLCKLHVMMWSVTGVMVCRGEGRRQRKGISLIKGIVVRSKEISSPCLISWSQCCTRICKMHLICNLQCIVVHHQMSPC